ncbi:MAG: hypothetical protein OEQ18_08875, partial [Gammaproteobacteria bacterium]|nr:hypothetical protein [Gammaproteobacteria bacterium]
MTGWLVSLVGLGLVLAAVLTSNVAIESAFGRSPGSLSWGPTLFRVLLALHGVLLIGMGFLRRRAPGDGATSKDAQERKTGAVVWICLG